MTLFVERLHPEIGGRVLHFAPEPHTEEMLRRRATEYVSSDLEKTADVQADITKMPFPDQRWDLIICSHVLEHVPDDASALREIKRMLAPGGRAILMTPRKRGGPTEEDPSASVEERIRRFGQHNHIRLYGDDLDDRIAAAGFDLIEPIVPEAFGIGDIEQFRLRESSEVENGAFFVGVN